MTENAQLEASNVLAWITLNGFVNEYNKPLEFVNHRFLIDYMVDDHNVIVTKKAAQVGMTVAETLRGIHYAAFGGKNTIHTLQTSDVIKGFVAPKVNPIIEYNPKIRALMKVDSESLKQFGENFIYYRGAQAESQAINITADVLNIDEYDRSNQKVVEVYRSRLDASPDPKIRYFSNPSAIGFGVDGLYQQSDQRHWFITCRRCGHANFIDWQPSDELNHYVDVDKAIYACGKCGKEITDKDRINGEWVTKYPDRKIHGYWVSQLMAPWVSAQHIIEKQITSSTEYFHNFVLGKAYTPTDLIVNRDTILRACSPSLIPKVQVAIGVDNGVVKHWVAGTPQGVFDYGKTESWEEIERLLLMYNAVMVIDANPYPNIPKQLVEKYKGRVFINYYKRDSKNLGIVLWREGKEYGVVTADRTKVFDLVANEIAESRLLFRQTPHQLEGYISHWANIYRTVDTDARGLERGVWVTQEGRPDHYCFDGSTFIKTLRGDIKIKNVRKSDHVLTSKGYCRVTRAWLTKKNAKVKKYKFSNGAEIIATPNHRIATEKGFIPLHDIVYSDKIKVWSRPKQLFSKALHIVDTQIQKLEARESIICQTEQNGPRAASVITRNSGFTITVLSQKALSFTTLMTTPSTTHWTISNLSNEENINQTIVCNISKTLSTLNATNDYWILSDLSLMLGVGLSRVKNGIANMLKKLGIVGSHFCLNVLGVVRNFLVTGNTILSGVQERVSIEFISENLGQRNVYNLTVEGNHEYYANGILVSNCHAQIYQRIALSRQLGASMGIGFVEPLTKEKPKADYINSEGKLVTDLSEQIEEALSGDNISTDWRYQ